MNIFTNEKINFSTTQAAVTRIQTILSKYISVAYKLRISVQGGGCAGFLYNFKLIENANEDDIVIITNNITILIDAPSVEFLNDCILDYIDDIGNSGFSISRPKEFGSGKCGCGNSFTL